MKILVLGASGMAGHVVGTYLEEQGNDVTLLAGHKKINDKTIILDLTQKQLLDDYLSNNTFDIVINCIGILVQQSENRKDLATYLNSFLPHYLAHRFANTNTKLIHLSTDCVFSGQNGPYKEDSPYDGDTFYDRSKALGEVVNDKDLTFRMSIIGPDAFEEGVGLFNWFQKQTGTIFGFKNAIWNGITTVELARGIDQAIKQNLTGLYHLTPKQNINKLDLITLFKKVFNRDDIIIKPKDNEPTDKTLINTRTDFDFKVNDYPTMIEEMKVWIDNHKDLYPHYNK